MSQRYTDTEASFICDNCDTVIEGSAAAQQHYSVCTLNADSEGENSHYSSQAADSRELLIGEVFCREPLWNTSIPYARRGFKVTSELWQEVDIALGVQTGWSQKTFKSLRDRFVKLLTEETNSKRSGSATMNKTNWKYFTQLEFLRPSVEYRSTISSLSKNKRPSAEVEASEASGSSKGKRFKSP
ncbi:uncharacterized protein [Temnothorax nylanderi]|uniref:uncharacterized protein n=1 Tax=Temnothorax nylanderi TaxID=102681 RepID=UPI003A8A4037